MTTHRGIRDGKPPNSYMINGRRVIFRTVRLDSKGWKQFMLDHCLEKMGYLDRDEVVIDVDERMSWHVSHRRCMR